MLPRLVGRPIRVEMRPSLGPHLAAASIPKRLILLDSEVLEHRGEFERILVHEIFHFAWVRLANGTRRSYEQVIASEMRCRAPGELGWSAELLKLQLKRSDPVRRTPAWRRYACESFCDSGACLFAGLRQHDEFTLPRQFRQLRQAWFGEKFPATGEISI